MPFETTYKNPEIIILRKTNIISYVESLKKNKNREIQMNLFPKQKQTHRHRKQTSSYHRGKEVGDKLGLWD